MRHSLTFALAAAAMFAVLSASATAQSFEGRKKCSSCHKSQAESWGDTAHAKAMDSLKPNTKAEAKKKAKLDPKKDYTKDKDCVGCHVDGWGKEGGYTVDDPSKFTDRGRLRILPRARLQVSRHPPQGRCGLREIEEDRPAPDAGGCRTGLQPLKRPAMPAT